MQKTIAIDQHLIFTDEPANAATCLFVIKIRLFVYLFTREYKRHAIFKQ